MSSQHRSVFYFYPLLGILYFFPKFLHNKNKKQNKTKIPKNTWLPASAYIWRTERKEWCKQKRQRHI